MRNINTPKFFFDTADASYIEKAWDKLSSIFSPEHVRGITTNPNAMNKVNAHTKSDFEKSVKSLVYMMSKIRPDGGGVVYVQHPSSVISADTFETWCKYTRGLGDELTRVVVKLPPYWHLLDATCVMSFIEHDFNVTGVADCSTAMMCFRYPVRYVSIIPGRMEEAGIDAKAQIRYANMGLPYSTEIITGSMRTIEGLKWVIEENTVPTIGSKVFDLIFNDGREQEFYDYFKLPFNIKPQPFSPPVSQANTDLSIAFFNQMDQMGAKLADDLVNTGF